MKHKPILGTRFLFATAPMPCPYLADRVERRVVVEMTGRDAPALHDALSAAGYRRSHGIAYAPACPDCSACVAVRIHAEVLVPSRSQRRVWRLNRDVAVAETTPAATREHFDLFADYQRSRHAEGDMMKMDFIDYQALVEDTPVDTLLVEFREPDGRLIGGCLTDRLNNGLSAVYSYFDSKLRRRSIGTYMILWLVERAKSLGLPYVYLGFWIADCAKMSYKTAFQPIEGYTPEGWKPITSDGVAGQ